MQILELSESNLAMIQESGSSFEQLFTIEETGYSVVWRRPAEKWIGETVVLCSAEPWRTRSNFLTLCYEISRLKALYDCCYGAYIATDDSISTDMESYSVSDSSLFQLA